MLFIVYWDLEFGLFIELDKEPSNECNIIVVLATTVVVRFELDNNLMKGSNIITWTKKNEPSMQKAKPMKSSDRMRSFRLPNLSTTRTEMEVPVTWITPTTMAQMLASNYDHCWELCFVEKSFTLLPAFWNICTM